MDDETARLARAVGARVRDARQARRWTLDRLAEQSGVSRRMVVAVEQGAANAGIGTLLRLSEALGVGLPALVAPAPGTAAAVTRAGAGAVLWSSEAGGSGVLVAASATPDALELWDWTLAAGDRRVSEAHAAGTREVLQVRSGSLDVEVAGESVRLEAGDAVAFPGDVEHVYIGVGAEPATFTLAVSEPAGGRGRGTSGRA